MTGVRLQVALDAVACAALERFIDEAVAGGADVIEIGTPMLKRYGVAVLKKARNCLPAEVPLYADVKMLDFAHLELAPALEAGADEVTAVAFASDESLSDALRLTTAVGASLSVTTMNYPLDLLPARLDTIQALGINRFVAHGAGANLEAASRGALERARDIRAVVGAHLLIGGGFRPANAHEVGPVLPATVIVGRSATNGPSIRHAVTAMRIALDAVAGLTASLPEPQPQQHAAPRRSAK